MKTTPGLDEADRLAATILAANGIKHADRYYLAAIEIRAYGNRRAESERKACERIARAMDDQATKHFWGGNVNEACGKIIIGIRKRKAPINPSEPGP